MDRQLIKLYVIIAIIYLFPQAGAASERIPVFVSIAPQKYFVQQIGRDRIDVQVMVTPGAAPHTYEPKPQQMAALSRSKLYFAIGIPLEKSWLKKIEATNPQLKVIRTDEGIAKVPMSDHRHQGGEGEHHGKEVADKGNDHGETDGLDPHIWLSPPLVKKQIHWMLTALQDIDPSHGDVYAANYEQFVTRIDHLDAQLRSIFADTQGLRFMVFHPSWGYFAHTYGLEQVSIEWEGKAPKPGQLKELIERARKDGINVIFAQPQFSTKSAAVIAKEIGGQVAFADPLAEDWLSNMQLVAAKFKAALK